jgi:hypothetical protein
MTARAEMTELSTVATLAGVTLKRLARGKALWIAGGLAVLPIAYAAVRHAHAAAVGFEELFAVVMLLVAVLPAMFVASSIGEEIEDRTSAYLWSRAIPRWAVVAGKLGALAPAAAALLVASWYAAMQVGGAAPSLASCLAIAGACITASVVAAGIATLVPRHAMVLTICYLLADNAIGALGFSLAELSITHQAKLIAGFADAPQEIAGPAVALAGVAAVWAAIAVLRIRRLEV